MKEKEKERKKEKEKEKERKKVGWKAFTIKYGSIPLAIHKGHHLHTQGRNVFDS